MQNPEMRCVGGKVAYLFLVIAISLLSDKSRLKSSYAGISIGYP